MSTTTAERSAAKPKSSPAWRCQFCAQGHHRSCPRATRYNGKLWVCQCRTGAEQHHSIYCLECKHDQVVDIQNWACIDPHACAVRRQQRNEANPLWRMIQRAKVHGAVERKAKKHKMETVLAGIDPESDESIERVHALLDSVTNLERKNPKKPKRSGPPKPRVGKCECCGEATRGGRFLPGHDARLAARLVQRVSEGELAAYEELEQRNWLKKIPRGLLVAITPDSSGMVAKVLK